MQKHLRGDGGNGGGVTNSVNKFNDQTRNIRRDVSGRN